VQKACTLQVASKPENLGLSEEGFGSPAYISRFARHVERLSVVFERFIEMAQVSSHFRQPAVRRSDCGFAVDLQADFEALLIRAPRRVQIPEIHLDNGYVAQGQESGVAVSGLPVVGEGLLPKLTGASQIALIIMKDCQRIERLCHPMPVSCFDVDPVRLFE
jgi:hypothetical protein